MNVHHVKYTVEFDIPIKISGSNLNPMVWTYLEDLLKHSVKTQLFYLSKEGEVTYSVRGKNITLSREIDDRDVEIKDMKPTRI
jgi:hypothetical protein